MIKTEAAKAVLGFFASEYGKAYLERLHALGIDPKAKAKTAAAVNAPLAGVTFVLTGTLSLPRNEYADRIKDAGGIVQEAVSKNTRFLVAGTDAGAAKITKARNLGTNVLDEAGLRALLSGSTVPQPTKPSAPPPAAVAPYQQQELF